MTSLQQSLPPPGQPLWQGAPSTRRRESRVRHITITGTHTRYEPSPHTIYKVDVQTGDNHWVVFRRYRQFHSLHQKMVKEYGIARDLLPPKRFGRSIHQDVVSKRRTQLEQYLQKIINSDPEVSGCPELFYFLEVSTYSVIEATAVLAQHLFSNGESLLSSPDAFTLTPNQMYCVSERLKLPLEPVYGDTPSTDPAHLYTFVHEVRQLLVAPPPCHTSQSCTSFDFTPFKSLLALHVHHVPCSQVQSLSSVHQQLELLSLTQAGISSVREVLVDKAADVRPGPAIRPETASQVDSWRLVATTKLQSKRVVVHPWHCLRALDLSRNQLTSLHPCLLLLHSLTDLDVGYNALTRLDLQYLTLPSLRSLVASHNCIREILPRKKVLESLVSLDLSHNHLRQTTGLSSFVNVIHLDLSHNFLRDPLCLKETRSMGDLSTLHLKGNILVSRQSYRLLVMTYFHSIQREVIVDGRSPTAKEVEQMAASIEKHGKDLFSWPSVKKLQLMVQSHDDHVTAAPLPPPGSPSPSEDLMVAIVHSSQLPRDPVDLMRNDSTDSLVRFDTDSDSLSPPSAFPTSRDMYEDDDDSLSSQPVFMSPCLNGSQETTPTIASNQVTPPPSTPLGASLSNQDGFLSNPKQNGAINPQAILSALLSLSRTLSESSDLRTPSRPSSPRQSFTSDEVATAIKSLINSQTTTPPSTPLTERKVDPEESISPSDLVLALRRLVAQNSGSGSMLGEELECPVPQSTPCEGEGRRRGEISIDDLMGALSSLSIGVGLESTTSSCSDPRLEGEAGGTAD